MGRDTAIRWRNRLQLKRAMRSIETAGLGGVPAGSTSCDVDRPGGLELGLGNLHLIQEDLAGFLRNPSQRGVTHRARLLVDFLEHERA